MHNQTQYVSKIPDKDGYRTYSDTEHKIWAKLYAAQEKSLPGIACPEYMSALEEIGLPRNSVPQLKNINETLKKKTGWGIEGVPALISFERFLGYWQRRSFRQQHLFVPKMTLNIYKNQIFFMRYLATVHC